MVDVLERALGLRARGYEDADTLRALAEAVLRRARKEARW